MIVLDKVNTADRPDTTIEAVVDDMVSQGAQLIFATSDDMRDGIIAAAARPSRRADDLGVRRQRLGRRAELPGRPHQPRQHHGQDRVRQDDRRMRRRPDDADRPHRLPRTADQRRDPPSRQLGVPRRPPLLGDVSRRGSGIARVRGQVDRLLVQHPRVHARPDAGHQRVPRQRRRRRHLRPRHHRGDRPCRPGRRVGRGRVGRALRLPGRLRRGARRLPRRALLQLGTVVPRDDAVRDRRELRRRVAVARTGLGGHQQPRHQRRRLAQWRGADGRVGDDARRVHRRARQRRDQPVHRPAQLPGRQPRTSPTARRRPTPRSGTRPSSSRASKAPAPPRSESTAPRPWASTTRHDHG